MQRKTTLFLTIFSLLISTKLVSQVIDYVYLDSEYRIVSKDSALFKRTIEQSEHDTKKYLVNTYYISGELKSESLTEDKSYFIINGHSYSFFKNGQKESECFYLDGRISGEYKGWFDNGKAKVIGKYRMGMKVGNWKYWYPNGQIKKVIQYSDELELKEHYRLRMIEYWSAEGKKVVENGNGKGVFYDDDTLTISSIGEYKNGIRTGTWVGFFRNGSKRYEEFYRNGYVKGVSWDKEGNKYDYDQIEVGSEAEGGLWSFYEYIATNLRYPNKARRKKVEGKVYVQFLINSNGKISEVQTVKGLGSGCDEEAERVIKNAPDWVPGKKRGQPTEIRMILPISFRIG